MIKLHYAELTNDSEIQIFEFPSIDALKWYLENDFTGNEKIKRVFLFTWNGEKDDIFISEYSDMPFKAMNYFNIDLGQKDDNFFLQEYYSFEDAYAVAMDMKEENKLCYDNRHEFN